MHFPQQLKYFPEEIKKLKIHPDFHKLNFEFEFSQWKNQYVLFKHSKRRREHSMREKKKRNKSTTFMPET